ncbi:MAG: hypothetical protein LBK13_08150 [Spirochaetales bacterium]|jgi:hypothetical protein|nr:hypothetical protein [Spirochaetales bacterium]
MIEPLLKSGTVPLSDVIAVRAAAGAAGRVSLPSNQFVSFEHISGMPTGQGGYSITKLRILDTLLDRLALLKGGGRQQPDTGGLSEAGLGKIIDELQKYVRRSVDNAAATPFGPALGSGASWDGQLFNYLI